MASSSTIRLKLLLTTFILLTFTSASNTNTNNPTLSQTSDPLTFKFLLQKLMQGMDIATYAQTTTINCIENVEKFGNQFILSLISFSTETNRDGIFNLTSALSKGGNAIKDCLTVNLMVANKSNNFMGRFSSFGNMLDSLQSKFTRESLQLAAIGISIRSAIEKANWSAMLNQIGLLLRIAIQTEPITVQLDRNLQQQYDDAQNTRKLETSSSSHVTSINIDEKMNRLRNPYSTLQFPSNLLDLSAEQWMYILKQYIINAKFLKQGQDLDGCQTNLTSLSHAISNTLSLLSGSVTIKVTVQDVDYTNGGITGLYALGEGFAAFGPVANKCYDLGVQTSAMWARISQAISQNPSFIPQNMNQHKTQLTNLMIIYYSCQRTFEWGCISQTWGRITSYILTWGFSS